MKKTKRILTILFLAALLISALCVPAFAVTESEVEAQVAASGKEAVAGNVLIWFLCAVAFLKVSQKIDSFMATLGVNVGRTGGSMLAEAMIAMRAVTMERSFGMCLESVKAEITEWQNWRAPTVQDVPAIIRGVLANGVLILVIYKEFNPVNSLAGDAVHLAG